MDADTECVDGIQGKWQTYLAKDVPDWIAGHRRMQTGAEHTAIAGYSMGGYCAQMTALRNPSVYSVSATSPARRPRRTTADRRPWGNDNLVKRQAGIRLHRHRQDATGLHSSAALADDRGVRSQ